MPVAAGVLGAENSIVKDAFEAIAVMWISGESQQVAGELKMRISSAGRLKMGVGCRDALSQPPPAWLNECLIGSPAAGGKLLRLLDHVPGVTDCGEILRLAEIQIGARR